MNELLLLKNDTAKHVDVKKSVSKEKDGKVDFKIFLAKLLSNVDKKGLKDKSIKIDTQKVSHDIKIDKKLPIDKSKKVDELLIGDLLKFVIFLKSNGLSGQFPKDSKKLVKILQNKEAIKDFKSVKSLEDILKVAKKYDIKIKKFDMKLLNGKDIKEVETKLVSLDTKELKKDHTKELKITSEKILSNIKQIKEPKIAQKEEKKQDILTKLMTAQKKKDGKIVKTKASKDNNITNNKNVQISKDNKTAKDIKDIKNGKEDISLRVADEKKSKTHNDTKIKESSKDASKEDISLRVADEKKSKTHNDTKIKESSKDATSKTTKETANHKDKNIKVTPKSTLKQENTIERDKLLKSDDKNIKASKDFNKIEQDSQEIKKDSETAQKESNNSHHNQKDNISHLHKQNGVAIEKLKSETTLKRSLNSFANDLRERIKEYKPPIMKVKMTLTPKDLGSVDVTMINRGDNLHITINSNNNTMALFVQNQAEFKNSLVNMGFTNLNMNFGSQNEGQKNNQKEQERKQSNFLEEIEELNNEEIDTVELTIPRYI